METIKDRIEDLFKTEPVNYSGASWGVRSALEIIAEKLDAIEERLNKEDENGDSKN